MSLFLRSLVLRLAPVRVKDGAAACPTPDLAETRQPFMIGTAGPPSPEGSSQNSSESVMRRLRNVIDRLVFYTGIVLVLGTMSFMEASVQQTSMVVSGLVLVQLGVWRAASSQLFSSDRRNQSHRDEVDQFIKLVREMYRAANAKEASVFETLADQLRTRTERVIDAARTDLA